jgi:hypothetical protein
MDKFQEGLMVVLSCLSPFILFLTIRWIYIKVKIKRAESYIRKAMKDEYVPGIEDIFNYTGRIWRGNIRED